MNRRLHIPGFLHVSTLVVKNTISQEPQNRGSLYVGKTICGLFPTQESQNRDSVHVGGKLTRSTRVDPDNHNTK